MVILYEQIHVPNDLAVELFLHYMENFLVLISNLSMSYMEKWDALYKECRKEMTNACSQAKDEVKHEAVDGLKI